jgi:hypothetical protein
MILKTPQNSGCGQGVPPIFALQISTTKLKPDRTKFAMSIIGGFDPSMVPGMPQRNLRKNGG